MTKVGQKFLGLRRRCLKWRRSQEVGSKVESIKKEVEKLQLYKKELENLMKGKSNPQ